MMDECIYNDDDERDMLNSLPKTETMLCNCICNVIMCIVMCAVEWNGTSIHMYM